MVKKINLYKKLNQIKIVSSGLKKILDEFNAIKSESYEKIQNIFDYINNENKEIIENDIEHKIKNLDIDYNNINDNYYKFFIKYEKYPDSINWLRKKNDKVFYLMRKFIIDSDDENEYLNFEKIKLAEKVKQFYDNLYNKNDSECILILKKKLRDEKIEKEININLKSEDIIEFFDYYENLEELSNKYDEKKNLENKLNNFLKYTFFIKYDENKKLFNLESIKYKEKEKIKTYQELNERVFFALSHSKEDDEINKNFMIFVNTKNDINKFIKLLNNRRDRSSNEKEYILEIKNNYLIFQNQKKEKEKNLKEVINVYGDDKEFEKVILLAYYEDNEFIVFFYDMQLIELYNFIKNKKFYIFYIW